MSYRIDCPCGETWTSDALVDIAPAVTAHARRCHQPVTVARVDVKPALPIVRYAIDHIDEESGARRFA